MLLIKARRRRNREARGNNEIKRKLGVMGKKEVGLLYINIRLDVHC